MIPRIVYYTPLTTNKMNIVSIHGQSLIKEEIRKINFLFSNFSNDDKFIWFTQRPTKGVCFKVDLTVLEISQIRQPNWTDDIIYRGDLMQNAIVGIINPNPINEDFDNRYYNEIIMLIEKDCNDFADGCRRSGLDDEQGLERGLGCLCQYRQLG